MILLLLAALAATVLALLTLVEARHDSRGDRLPPSSHVVDRQFLAPSQRL